MDYAIRDTVQVMLAIARSEAQVSITSVNSVPTHYHMIVFTMFDISFEF